MKHSLNIKNLSLLEDLSDKQQTNICGGLDSADSADFLTIFPTILDTSQIEKSSARPLKKRPPRR